MIKRYLTIACLGLFALASFACSKPALYGTTQESESVVKYYSVPPKQAFRAAKEALHYLGYSIKQEDPQKLFLETYWQPATADSHYVEVFGRRDYGTVGAYYRVVILIKSRANGSSLKITNVAKSIISNVKSSNREEDKIVSKINDFTRRRDIQVTNIGLQ